MTKAQQLSLLYAARSTLDALAFIILNFDKYEEEKVEDFDKLLKNIKKNGKALRKNVERLEDLLFEGVLKEKNV